MYDILKAMTLLFELFWSNIELITRILTIPLFVVFSVMFGPYTVFEAASRALPFLQLDSLLFERLTSLWIGIVIGTAVSFYGTFFVNRQRKLQKKPLLTKRTVFLIWFALADIFGGILLWSSDFYQYMLEFSPTLSFIWLILYVGSHVTVFFLILYWVGTVLTRGAARVFGKHPSVDWWKKHRKLPVSYASVAVAIPILCIFSFVFWVLTEDYLQPQAGRFFIINAAIKNTCFMDPDRRNCPQVLEEIGYIEPQEYQNMMECCQVNYQYHPDLEQYSLVIRYNPTKAVVFDWRLTDELGVDFKEYQVSLFGQDQLVDPPAWEGPWQFADWPYLSK